MATSSPVQLFLPIFLVSQVRCQMDVSEATILPEDDDAVNAVVTDSSEFYQSDMKLTVSQIEMLTASPLTTRKGLANAFFLWPEGSNGFPLVHYHFADKLVNKQSVRNAIQHWEEHTCVRFAPSKAKGPKISFKMRNGCWSYVGYLGAIAAFANGQDVSIGSGCTRLATVVHEIGHSLGLFHEQTRPDRDEFVHVNERNIKSAMLDNFAKLRDSVVDDYGVAYDLSSNMHYGGRYFSINNGLTIATVDPLNQELIGQRTGLSHRDKLIANRMYKCIEKWEEKCQQKDQCQNEGYLGSDCACVCRGGTSGELCEIIEESYYASLRSSCNINVTEETIVTSPNYPSKYPAGVICATQIVAPECQTPEVTFNDFSIYGNKKNCFDKLEIRTNDQFDGSVYCGSDKLMGTTHTSEHQTLVLLFYTRTGSRNGWSADVKFRDIPRCVPKNPTGSSGTSEPLTLSTEPPTAAPVMSRECSVERKGEAFVWSSPNFGLADYPDDVRCNLTQAMSVPRMAVYTFESFQLQNKNKRCLDYLEIEVHFIQKRKLCGTLPPDFTISVPYFNFDNTFKSDRSVSDAGFSVTVTPMPSPCHKVINLTLDRPSDVIATPNYPDNFEAGDMCEWWVMAPEDQRMEFILPRINLPRSRGCQSSYVAIDRVGEGRYRRKTTSIYCITRKAKTIISKANVLKVAFFGGDKPVQGFQATVQLQGS